MAMIYLSHSPSDEPFARQIAQSLVDLGADVWLDTAELPNLRWHHDLAEGFEMCDALVVILSQISVAERRVINDWSNYMQQGKPVVLAANGDPTAYGVPLSAGQYVDFRAQPYDAALRTLTDTLRYYQILPPAPVSPPPVATVPLRTQAAAQPAPTRDAGLTQPTVSQETGLTPKTQSPRRSSLLVPVVLGLLLALIAVGALVFLVLLPQADRANQDATSTVVAQFDRLTQEAQFEIDAATNMAMAAVQATNDALQATTVALAQQESAVEQAGTATAAASTQIVMQATTVAMNAAAQATAAAEDLMLSAATLGALQGTISAQQALNQGFVPAIAPSTNRFTSQSLIYSLQREWLIDSYAVRLWQDPTSTYQSLTIDQVDQPRVQIDSFVGGAVSELTGTDITGEGSPDVIYEIAYSDAAALRCSVVIYDLGARAVKIAETPAGACGARFTDLDADGRREMIVNDTTYVGQFCNTAESPMVEVIVAYDRTQRRFIPLSARFASYYQTAAQAYLARVDLAAQVTTQAEAGQMESAQCSVLGLVLPYLYGGMAETAWAQLRTYYPYADAAQFQAEINTLFNSSPFCK